MDVQLAHTGLSLTSCTESEMLDGENAAMLGDELIFFQNATHSGGGLYELDTFVRGGRGTEWAKDSHTSGERFVLLTNTSIRLHKAPLSDLNAVRYYRGVTLGNPVTIGHTVSLTAAGRSLMPYSPSGVATVRDSTNSRLLVHWTRRTRISGEIDWTTTAEIPLGEAEERYELDLLYKVSGEVYATYQTVGSGSRQTSTSVTFTADTPTSNIVRLTSTGITEGNYVEDKLCRVSGADEQNNNGTFLIDNVDATNGYLELANANAVTDTDTADTKIIDEIGEQIVIPQADLQSAGYTDIDDDVDVVVYQISAVVGRGYPTEATV